mmetsp:Transcript_46255/g.142673  ORF Transcript_46255/g.142673 Transcript_46255/m.142673 type:complete len:387 (-) Transcript_46255:266-1426(-)
MRMLSNGPKNCTKRTKSVSRTISRGSLPDVGASRPQVTMGYSIGCRFGQRSASKNALAVVSPTKPCAVHHSSAGRSFALSSYPEELALPEAAASGDGPRACCSHCSVAASPAPGALAKSNPAGSTAGAGVAPALPWAGASAMSTAPAFGCSGLAGADPRVPSRLAKRSSSAVTHSAKNSSCSSCATVGRSAGRLRMQRRMNAYTLEPTRSSRSAGKRSSSDLVSLMNRTSWKSLPTLRNGRSPTASSHAVAPMDQMSAAMLPPRPLDDTSNISGAIQNGVPCSEWNCPSSRLPRSTAHPKSLSLHTPSCVRSKFSPLMSRWTIPRWCRYASPRHAWYRYDLMAPSGSGCPASVYRWCSEPPSQYSRRMCARVLSASAAGSSASSAT